MIRDSSNQNGAHSEIRLRGLFSNRNKVKKYKEQDNVLYKRVASFCQDPNKTTTTYNSIVL